MSASPAPSSPAPASMRGWIELGQQHEHRGTPGECAQALRCYDQALALADNASPTSASVHLRAVAAMNRGNVLQKLARTHEAVAAYDSAIAQLAPEPASEIHDASLGAAWLNRGCALLSLKETPTALVSFEHALTVLARLPLEREAVYRRHFAAAHLYRGNLRLATDRAAAEANATLAQQTLQADVFHDRASADLALQAAHLQCVALLASDLPFAGEPRRRWRTEISDRLDSALALAHRWLAAPPAPTLLPSVLPLYRLGLAFHREHWPRHLPEFALETLHRLPSALPLVTQTPFRTAALEALRSLWHEIQNERLAHLDQAMHGSLATTLETVTSALAELESHLAD